MSRVVRVQTSFAAGVLDPVLAGRNDLRARGEGARTLRNVLPLATGGLVRRPGTRVVAESANAGRLVAWPDPAGDMLVVAAPDRIDLFESGQLIASFPLVPAWAEGELAELSWAVVQGRLLLCHPAHKPLLLGRDPQGDWLLDNWRLDRIDPGDPASPPRGPFHKFASTGAELQLALGGQTAVQPIAAGSVVELVASEPIFVDAHQGSWMRLRGGHLTVTGVLAADRAQAVLRDAQPDGGPTTDWQEEAFSAVRGWPRCVTWYQDRLVVGGSRDLPDMVWLSRTGRPYDFDVGTGLDDEAIAFRLASAEPHLIRQMFSGRRLQIFTTRGEWVVQGHPVTPRAVAAELQTRVGSPVERAPRVSEVDGATLFVGASGREVREFVYADTEQAYQAADIALLSRHLVYDVVDTAFDSSRRLLLVLRADGTFASCTIDRNANVVAWAEHVTDGAVRAIEVAPDGVWFLVRRGARTLLERWDEEVYADSVRILTSAAPATEWNGLSDYAGRRVALVADGRFAGIVDLSGDSVVLAEPASELLVGLPYRHVVEPDTVPVGAGSGLPPDALHRPVRLVLRLHATRALRVDAGLGTRSVRLPGDPYSGDVTLRAMGWRRGPDRPAWRIEQEDPLPFALLSATVDTRVNG